MAGVKHTFSVNIADDASALAAGEVLPSHWNAEHTLSDVAAQTSLNAVSNSLSILQAAISTGSVRTSAAGASVRGYQAVLDAISNRISVEAPVGGGGGSVTSAELVAGDNAVSAQAASALSQALSVLSVNDAALSARVDSVANAVSVVSNALSNEISNRLSHANVVSNAASNALSVANAASNAASVVSNALSNEISNRISADNVLSNSISVVSNALSNEISNRISADNALSNAISTVSNALSNEISNRTSADNVVSAQAASAISQLQSLLSQRISALSVDALKGVSLSNPTSTQVLKYFSAAGEWRNAADATGGAGGSGTQSITSAVSNAVSNLNSLVSNVSVLSSPSGSVVAGLQSVLNTFSNMFSNSFSAGNVVSDKISVLSNQVSVLSQGLSVVSNALSNEISNRISADNVLSQALSVHSQQLSLLSGKVSAGIGTSAQTRVLGQTFTVSTTGLTNITSLSLSVEAGGVYHIEAVLVASHSSLNAFGMGISLPGGTNAGGEFIGYISIYGNPGYAGNFSSTRAGVTPHNELGGNSILLSGVAGSSAVNMPYFYRGLYVCSTAGTINMLARMSLAGTPMAIKAGSFIRAYRLN